MCHQIAEKGFKAVIASQTDTPPPRTHDLLKLAKLGGVFGDLSEEQFELLDILKPLQIEARYPADKDKIGKSLSEDRCIKILAATEELLCWIKQKLEK